MTPNVEFVEIPPVFPNLDDLIGSCSDLKQEDLEQLRKWVQKQPHLPPVPDEQLVTFMHACYYSLERAKKMVDKHYTIRTHAPELFASRDVLNPEIQKHLQLFRLGTLKWKTPLGYWVLAGCLLPHVDAMEYIFDLDVKITLMAIELLIRLDPVAPGYVSVLDFKGITMAHVARAGIGTIRKLFAFAQGAMNFRLKEIHIIHVTPLIDSIMSLIKPFLWKELADMLHFHSGEMEDFYEQFPREVLPKEFGGTYLTMENYHANSCRRMREHREWLLEQDKLLVDETRRPGSATDLFGVQGSFKRLEID